jgi:hypothetical protein
MDGQQIGSTSSSNKIKNKKRRIEIELTATSFIDHHQELRQQWLNQDEGGLLVYTLSFLDVKTLLQKELISKAWRHLCKKTIDDKCGNNGPKPFESNQELKDAVEKYCRYSTEMEEIACTYGYPIDKWNVSQVRDMSEVFLQMDTFNEYIGS